MGTIKFNTMIKPNFRHVANTRLFFEFLLDPMFSFSGVFLSSVFAFLLKIYGFFCRYAYGRPKSGFAEESGSSFSANRSPEEQSLDLQKSGEDCNGSDADTECSVFLQSGLVGNNNNNNNNNSSKCQFMSADDVRGYLEEPKPMEFIVQEMFVGSDDDNSDQNLGLQKNLLEFDQETECSFSFSLLNGSWSVIGEERKQVCEEREKPNSDQSSYFGVEDMDSVLEEEDFSYQVELLPLSQFSILDQNQESDETERRVLEGNDSKNWMTTFLDEIDERKSRDLRDIDHTYFDLDDDDDEYIELELLSGKESTSLKDPNKELHKNEGTMQSEVATSPDTSHSWDSDSDSDSDLENDSDDEADVLSEHQNLVQQMKMELKNCTIRGLPTISEECETPKIAQDLKPLQIDHKIQYKDIMDEIHKFHKSYADKMRKLDILNFQTLHAISFLQLKDSEVFTGSTKREGSVPWTVKLWTSKVQRIYADPMHNKAINEMHRDLELVYVGQLCLSWEILSWLYVKAQELLEYDSQGNNHRSYNRSAEEFQQFQVLLQRFMEDEPFQGHRTQNYAKNRCTIRSLLQVPTIKDDCKKEGKEERDAISLRVLVETIRESMLILREFVRADKANIVLKGIQEPGNSQLAVEIVSNLHKKERRIREEMRSQNCIVKKLRKNEECGVKKEVLICEVDLRLVRRVVCVSRLTRDHLDWCVKKLNNINFVGRKVLVEPSFLLFPC